MRQVEELDGWRRTHYSIEVTPSLQGEGVTVFGWVRSVRRQGGITFLVIQDKEGILQITAKRDATSRAILQKLDGLTLHTSIGVKGVVEAIDKAPHGAELTPKEIKVVGIAHRHPPFRLYGRRLPSIDKRLDIRALDLRRPRAQAIFRLRHHTLAAIRDFFLKNGYVEVNTPKIIASATEGGAALFPLLYYDKEAFLTQSPQLYKEQLVLAFEKVFEIGPAFRAEQSRTLAHLSEFVSVDVEEAYVDYLDVVNILERLIHSVSKTILKKCRAEIDMLGVDLAIYHQPFERYKYDEVLEMLQKEGVKVEWGEDFSTPALDTIGEILKGFYFIIDWPTTSKPFYIKPRIDKPEVCEAFDLMHSSVEVASGGSRISSKSLLVKRLKEKGLKPKNFEYYLKIFDYGMPPHAGFGLGLERFLMTITGQTNIREVSLFPRDQFHLTP